MTSSENSGSKMQNAGKGDPEEANMYADEINLMDYFRVIWKRRWFIFLASVLPALVIGQAIFLLPRDYRISYAYNATLGEKSFKTLENTFYSGENLYKLIAQLQQNGLERHAKRIAETKTLEDLKEFVSFEVSPSYFEAMGPSETKNVDALQKIQRVKGNLLIMRIAAKSEEHIREIALVCRENYEQIIPLYSVREGLNSKSVSLKEEMADIQETKYTLNLQLERKKSTLEKLRTSGSEGLDKSPSEIILQFSNVGEDSVFLPLAYQVQAAETQIINLEEQIRANKEQYDYCNELLKLNEKLLGNSKKVTSSHFTIESFHAFLIDTLAEYEENDQQLQDYLKAYIKRIENMIANTMPLVEKPKVYPVAKGAVKKSAIVFAVALTISVLASLLSEGLKKSQAQVS